MTQQDQNLSKLRDVSDTAWAVAALRATESERPDALFKDPYARRLVGERGSAIIANMSPDYDMSWFMAIRTKILDEIVLRAIKSHGIDCVVNLAADPARADDVRRLREELFAELTRQEDPRVLGRGAVFDEYPSPHRAK